MFVLNIGQRLLVVATLVSLGLLGLASFAYFKLDNVKQVARKTEKVRVQQLAQAATTELNVTRVSLQLRHAILARNPAELEGALADIVKKRALIDEAVKAYEATLYTDNGRTVFAKLPGVLEQFWSAGNQNIRLIQDGRKDEAFAFLVDHTIPARNAVLAVLSDMVDYQRSTLTQDIDGIGGSVDVTLNAILLLSLGCTVGLFLASLYVGRVLRSRVQFTGQIAERIRDGNLNEAIRDNSRDEFGPLVAAMGGMQVRLNEVVTRVRRGADFVDVASNSIADDTNDLSDRTRGQAASLRATTEAAKLLASEIENNFDNAKSAVALSKDAVEVAVKGGAVVSQVVSTMDDINTSSKRIEEIIGVINGIAFQTNILALNAAVEAARAGEQGKGFAVVAAEVRSLAQRSSQAANEIKQLISASVERVAAGSELVAQAGATMQEIVDSIHKVEDIVNSINAASEEQNRSLQDVNGTMTDMEKATEQNAGLVHKMNQSTNELRGMADELVSTVAYFKIDSSVLASPRTRPLALASS